MVERICWVTQISRSMRERSRTQQMDFALRTDLKASHLFRDSKSGTWRGWTTGFSALDGAGRTEVKTILAIRSTRDPRRGFSIMQARPVGIAGAHEDPYGIYDREAGKWRLLLCEHDKKYRASIWESDQWDHGYTRLADPVEMDSAGTMIASRTSKADVFEVSLAAKR